MELLLCDGFQLLFSWPCLAEGVFEEGLNSHSGFSVFFGKYAMLTSFVMTSFTLCPSRRSAGTYLRIR